jgi:hypothetical protein
MSHAEMHLKNSGFIFDYDFIEDIRIIPVKTNYSKPFRCPFKRSGSG